VSVPAVHHPWQTPYLTITSEKYEIQHPTHKLSPGINLVGSVTADSFKDLLLPGKVCLTLSATSHG
jgi:hypothetical protein